MILVVKKNRLLIKFVYINENILSKMHENTQSIRGFAENFKHGLKSQTAILTITVTS